MKLLHFPHEIRINIIRPCTVLRIQRIEGKGKLLITSFRKMITFIANNENYFIFAFLLLITTTISIGINIVSWPQMEIDFIRWLHSIFFIHLISCDQTNACVWR